MIKLVNLHHDEWVFDDDRISFAIHEELDQAIEYWREGKYDIAEKKLKDIISENVYHIDAFHHLSILYADWSMELEAYLCCREAARIGLSVIPESRSPFRGSHQSLFGATSITARSCVHTTISDYGCRKEMRLMIQSKFLRIYCQYARMIILVFVTYCLSYG